MNDLLTQFLSVLQFGTTIMEAAVDKLYTKQKQLEKGVAFPVCISVNDIVCNHSPLSSEELVRN
jgi:methionine aminopeptidase